ncbi:hypothetical protein [Chondromyces crocatus]|nr:hypothetical protein [Chondromyces crocatus]
MKERRESSPPPVVHPGEDPVLDAALARLRRHPGRDGTSVKAGAARGPDGSRAVAARGGSRARAPRGPDPARGWWIIGFSALAIVGSVVVMSLAVIGRRQGPMTSHGPLGDEATAPRDAARRTSTLFTPTRGADAPTARPVGPDARPSEAPPEAATSAPGPGPDAVEMRR